jgi:hypothetical protein
MDDIYADEEKKIFVYRDGMRDDGSRPELWGDPRAIAQDLALELDGDPNRFIRDSGGRFERDENGQPIRPKDPETGAEIPESPDEIVFRIRAEKRLYAAVRKAFGLEPFNRLTRTGATEAHCQEALNRYLGWLSKNAQGAGI